MTATRLLPILMIVAAITFGVRFSDLLEKISAKNAYAAASSLNDTAPAAGEGENAPPPSQEGLPKTDSDEAKAAAAQKADAQEEAAAKVEGKPEIEPPSLGPAPAAEKAEAAPTDWKGADDLDDEYADVKMEMFSDLSKRRKDLEAKEKELVMREALLKAAQAELTQKTNELNTIKSEIETLLKQQTEQEDKRIASLVKIYEGMKAKDAAKIFNNLDMDVLLQVVTKMSERKSAPIIAAMDEDKARSVTIMLAEQNKLPDLPQLPLPQ